MRNKFSKGFDSVQIGPGSWMIYLSRCLQSVLTYIIHWFSQSRREMVASTRNSHPLWKMRKKRMMERKRRQPPSPPSTQGDPPLHTAGGLEAIKAIWAWAWSSWPQDQCHFTHLSESPVRIPQKPNWKLTPLTMVKRKRRTWNCSLQLWIVLDPLTSVQGKNSHHIILSQVKMAGFHSFSTWLVNYSAFWAFLLHRCLPWILQLSWIWGVIFYLDMEMHAVWK